MRADLSTRAPNDVCLTAGVPPHSSWGQALARTIIKQAFVDVHYLQVLLSYCEGLPKAALDVSFPVDRAPWPTATIQFVHSKYSEEEIRAEQERLALLAQQPAPEPPRQYPPPPPTLMNDDPQPDESEAWRQEEIRLSEPPAPPRATPLPPSEPLSESMEALVTAIRSRGPVR